MNTPDDIRVFFDSFEKDPEQALIMIRNSKTYKKWLEKSKYVPPKPRSVQLSIQKMKRLVNEIS